MFRCNNMRVCWSTIQLAFVILRLMCTSFSYLAGRTHMITQRETSGLNTFVGKFSLPSLIFISLCKIDLSSVNWMFILAIFVSKTIIFFLVLIITVVVTRPTNTARAGLLAIFCTQTNDFAIGVPIGNYRNSSVYYLWDINYRVISQFKLYTVKLIRISKHICTCWLLYR